MDNIVLGFGIYIIVFALMFLLFLPLSAAQHEKGENIAPQLGRLVLWLLPAAFIVTMMLGFFLL